MTFTWTAGDISAGTALTSDDHIYETHINELRNAADQLYGHVFVVVGSALADYITDGTDDNVQIQAAIDAVSTAGGGIVHLKEGTYNISAVINMEDNIILEGEGDTTVIKQTSASNYNMIQSGGMPTSAEGQGSYTILRDLKFDGNRSVVTGSGSIVWFGCTKPLFINLHIVDMYGTGILLEDCLGGKVINCTLDNCRDGSITFYDGCVDCTAENNLIQNGDGVYGIYLLGQENETGEEASRGLKAINNTVLNELSGIAIRTNVTQSLVANNYIYNCSGYGIEIFSERIGTTNLVTSDNLITGNVVGSCATGIRVDASGTTLFAEKNSVVGNLAKDCTFGIQVTARGSATLVATNMLLGNDTQLQDVGTVSILSGNGTA